MGSISQHILCLITFWDICTTVHLTLSRLSGEAMFNSASSMGAVLHGHCLISTAVLATHQMTFVYHTKRSPDFITSFQLKACSHFQENTVFNQNRKWTCVSLSWECTLCSFDRQSIDWTSNTEELKTSSSVFFPPRSIYGWSKIVIEKIYIGKKANIANGRKAAGLWWSDQLLVKKTGVLSSPKNVSPWKTKQRSLKSLQTTSLYYSNAISTLKVPLTFNKFEKNQLENFNFAHLLSFLFFLSSPTSIAQKVYGLCKF